MFVSSLYNRIFEFFKRAGRSGIVDRFKTDIFVFYVRLSFLYFVDIPYANIVATDSSFFDRIRTLIPASDLMHSITSSRFLAVLYAAVATE